MSRNLSVFVAVLMLTAWSAPSSPLSAEEPTLELVGLTVTPHVVAPSMQYRRPRDPSLGARVEIFLRNNGEEALTIPAEFATRFRGKTPAELLSEDAWTWYDLPAAWPEQDLSLPPGHP